MFLNNFLNRKINHNFIIICFCAHLFFWDAVFGKFYMFDTNVFSFKILIIFPFLLYFINNYKLIIKQNLIIIYIGFFLFFHLIFSLDLNSFFFKNFFKLLFILSVLIVCWFYNDFISKNLKNIIYLFLAIILFSFIIEIIFLGTEDLSNKYFFILNSYIFLENSHLAMSILPVIFFLIFTERTKFLYLNIIFGIFFTTFSLIFFYSTTLFLGFFLILFFSLLFFFGEMKKRFFLIIVLLISIFSSVQVRSYTLKNNYLLFDRDIKISSLKSLSQTIYTGDTYNYNYDIKNKISKQNLYDLWKKETNVNIRDFLIRNFDNLPTEPIKIKYDLSTNVLINSAMVTFFSMKEKFYGYGINNYELAFAKQMLSENITVSTYEKVIYLLNYNDAASNFFKLLTEFGIFSLMIGYIIFKYVFNDKVPISEKLFFISIILVQSCRGAGYINGGFCFAFGMILRSTFYKKY
jgi:hypothetical protein